MRYLLFTIAFISLLGSASANRTIQGVVAVSTGPMQAKYIDAAREIGRDLQAGDSIFLNDEVETGQQTKAQILLKDESVFSISPNSKVIFDEFIYDPFAQTGALSAQLLNGGVRFVSGKIANRQPQNIKIKAGSATVGIRGTEIIAQHSDQGSTFVLLSGAMEISTPAGLQTINRPGFGLDVSADGILGGVRRVPLEEINQLLSPPSKENDNTEAKANDSNEPAAEEDRPANDTSEGAQESEQTEVSSLEANTTPEDSNGNAENKNVPDEETGISQPPAKDQNASAFDNALISAMDNSMDEKINLVAVSTNISLNREPSSDGGTIKKETSQRNKESNIDESAQSSTDSISNQTEETGPAQENTEIKLNFEIGDQDLASNEADLGQDVASIIDDLAADDTSKSGEEKRDSDGDGVADILDVFPDDATEVADRDGDGTGDNSDIFPDDATEIADLDLDGVGDNSDTDRDGDGVANASDAFPDNSSETADLDNDGIGDNADTDRDGDGVANSDDVFPENQERNMLALTLSQSTAVTKPYFTSTAKTLIRAGTYFQSSDPSQFDPTRDLLREKFSNATVNSSLSADGFDQVEDITNYEVTLDDYDAVLIYLDTDNPLSSSEQEDLKGFIQGDKKVIIIGRQKNNSQDPVNSALNIFEDDNVEYSATFASIDEVSNTNYSSKHTATISPVTNSTSSLLDGVDQFFGYYRFNSGFPYSKILSDDLDDDPDAGLETAPTGVLAIYNDEDDSEGFIQAAEFGSDGAMFISRFSCGANSSDNGYLGASINKNFVSDGRLQFCRNLFSSMAPANSLIDAKVGTIEIEGTDQGVTFALNNHTDYFKIVGDTVLIKAGASPPAGDYALEIDASPTGGIQQNLTLTVNVSEVEHETRIISSRQTVNVGQSVNLDVSNLKTQAADLADISWVSVSGGIYSGAPTETGKIILHYQETEAGTTYDRFHEIEVNYDCSSDSCEDFATSMDTETTLENGRHFQSGQTIDNIYRPNDFTSWSSFFDRFTTGTGRFSSRNYQQNSPFSLDYHHDLEINYGNRIGLLETDGTIGNNTVDDSWQFSFLGSGDACGSYECIFEDDSNSYDLTVRLANMRLPNGKHSLMIKSYVTGIGTGYFDSDFEPMIPQ